MLQRVSTGNLFAASPFLSQVKQEEIATWLSTRIALKAP
jgi:hypothetical protein